MPRQIYVNLAVRDLERSKRFFSSLGFGFEPKFTDRNAACMVVSDNIFVMFLSEPFFGTFTSKALCDATKSTEVLVCLTCGSRPEVDDLVAKAVAAGGKTPRVAGPWFHVRARLRRPRRSHMGARLHGAGRSATPLRPLQLKSCPTRRCNRAGAK